MERIVKLMTSRDAYDIRECASSSMSVRDLIERLEELPQDSKIVLSFDRDYIFGDIRYNSFEIEDVETYEEQEERERREEEEEEEEEYGIWEMCPHCNHEVMLKDQFRWQICPMCNRPILPCRLCDCDCVECSKCPLEKKEDMVLETEIEIECLEGLWDCECYDGYAICENIKTGRYVSLTYPKKADIDYDTAMQILHYRGLYNVSAEDITYGDIMMNYGEIEKN